LNAQLQLGFIGNFTNEIASRAHSDEVAAGSSKECALQQELRAAGLMQSGRIRLSCIDPDGGFSRGWKN
jgi:hypothetical protein